MYKTNGLLDSCHQKDLDVGDTWHSAPRPCRGHRRRNSSIYFRNPNLRPSVGQWAQKRGYWENESANHPVAQVSSSRLSSSWSLIPDTLSCSPAWGISSCSSRLLFFLHHSDAGMCFCLPRLAEGPVEQWLVTRVVACHQSCASSTVVTALRALNRCLLTKSVRQMPPASEGQIEGS